MKIREEDGELEIDVYSHFLFRFWGFMFIAAGLLFLLPLLVQYRIICEEKGYSVAKQCVLRTSFLKLYNRYTPLGELKSATISNYVEGRTDTVYFFLLLNTSEGFIKIPHIYSKKNIDIADAADRVETYIKTSLKKSISVPKIDNWWSYLKVAIFPLLGFGSLLFRLITIRFSKKTNTVTIAAKNIINTHENKISFADIEKLIIKEKGQTHKEFYLYLLLKNGKEIDLPGVHYSSLEQLKKIAEKINPYLALNP